MQRGVKLGWYILFTAPLLLIFVTVVLIPFGIGVGYSFFDWDGLPLNPKIFVGKQNFVDLFIDRSFLHTIGQTLCFTVLSVFFVNLFGLAFALIVTTSLKMKNVARTMLLMPYLIGGLILGYLWRFILSDGLTFIGEQTGLINIFFNWLLDPAFALWSLVMVTTWQMAGYMMIIYIAGMMSIPEEVHEAAQMDGAGFFRELFQIKFPLLMPAFTICLFMTLSNCFKIFDINLSLTGGGPHKATEMIALNIYHEIFALNNYGYGQAKAIVFFLGVATVTLFQVSLTKKREVEM